MSVDLHLMVSLQSETVSRLARSTAGALVAGLWQGMVLCAATGVLLKAVPKSSATLRFVIWAAVFGVSAAMPLVNLAGLPSLVPIEARRGSQVVLDLSWSYLLAGLWVSAAMYRLVQLAMQGMGLRTMWKTARPVEAEVLTNLDAPLVVDGRKVELCTSSEVDRPSVIGFFAPRILIPGWLFGQLTATELNHIVLHELEHLRRRDDWVNLFQKIGLVLLPLNPALFWIDRRLSTERELACDDGVLERTKMPRAYAASLTSIAERRLSLQRHGRLGTLALAATGLRRQRSDLGKRIESILGRRTPLNRAVAGGFATAMVAGILGAGVGLAHAPRLVSFGTRAQHASVEGAHDSLLAPVAASARVPQVFATAKIQDPVAKFEDVSFHATSTLRVKRTKPVARRAVTTARVQQVSQNVAVTPKRQQFTVLASWEESPVSGVVVQTPDGKFFLAPFAAVPTQAGWLIVQL